MRVLCAILATLAALAPCAAASGPSTARLVSILENAEHLPFEYRADLQLAVFASGKALPRRLAENTLERLAADASVAQFPVKLRDITKDPWNLSERLGRAMTLGLDSLSVRSRIIRAMLRFDPKRAREMVRDTQLVLPPLGCESAMVYDTSNFYQAAGEVLAKPNTATDAAGQTLIEQLIRQVHSPSQLQPAVRLLLSMDLPAEKLRRYTSLYSQNLKEMSATDRELGSLESANSSFTDALERLVSRVGATSVEGAELLRAYRSFLVGSSRQEKCADQPADRERMAKSFNLLLKHKTGAPNVPELRLDDLRPSRKGGNFKVDKIRYDGTRAPLFRSLYAYRTLQGSDTQSMDPVVAKNAETSAEELLQRVEGIDVTAGACHACLFQEKAEVFFGLYDLSPEGARERILKHLIAFMARDPSEVENPIQWLYRFKLLLNLARSPSRDDKERIQRLQDRPGKLLLFLPHDDRLSILHALEEQSDDIMSQYVRAERSLAIPYEMPPY